MNKGGFLVYKCRKCGELNKSIHTPDMNMTITLMAIGLDLPKEWVGMHPKMIDIHSCKDGSLGISDLVGGEEDKD